MVDLLIGMLAGLCLVFVGFCLGVRNERGKRDRVDRIREMEAEEAEDRPRGGTKMRRLTLRR